MPAPLLYASFVQLFPTDTCILKKIQPTRYYNDLFIDTVVNLKKQCKLVLELGPTKSHTDSKLYLFEKIGKLTKVTRD